MKLFLALPALLLVSSLRLARGTMYTCMIYGNGVPSNIKNKIDVDSDALLQKLKDYEGSAYTVLAPGQSSARARDVRDLAWETVEGEAAAPAPPPVESVSEPMQYTAAAATDGDGPSAPTSRNLVGFCPNSCSNSGSTYCRSLGCAYCGTCRRFLRTLATATSVENAMNRLLAPYCQGVAGCTLWSKVLVVNGDGSLSPAP
jgi:hypothetical protein